MLCSNFICDHIVSTVRFKLAVRPALEADQYCQTYQIVSVAHMYLFTIHNVHSSSTYLADMHPNATSDRHPPPTALDLNEISRRAVTEGT